MKKWKSWNCHDCDVQEGQLHKLGCDMERCPFCGGQLISCGHYDMFAMRDAIRIPYILTPNLCALCGEQWPEDFSVSDKEWEKYMIPSLQDKILCLECYKEVQKLFPKGWKKAT